MNKEFLRRIIITGMATLLITNMSYISASAKWVNDSKNNWSWLEDKTKAIGWKEIEKRWYYFNKDGIMNTGWLNYNGVWYNLSNSGSMYIGWKNIDGKWYHFKDDGAMSIGWINDNGTWYFTNFNGEMETGALGIDGKVYNFSDSGALINDKEIIQEVQPGSEDVSNVKENSDSRIAYVATNSGSLNIRLDATTSSSIIGTLARGTEVKIIEDERNGFYPIIAGGKKGWVNSKWISFQEPENDEPNTSSSDDSDEDASPIDSDDMDLNDDSLDKGVLRDTEPSVDNKYYYSDGNIFYRVKLSPPFYSGGKQIKGNCTWYAWGRAWELTGIQPNDAGFIGNGYEWWEANKKSGKYEYGTKPKVGAIAVWKSGLPNSGGSGHVAVVEKIENNKIYISESTWHGAAFRYREIYETSYLYGYIYLDEPNY